MHAPGNYHGQQKALSPAREAFALLSWISRKALCLILALVQNINLIGNS